MTKKLSLTCAVILASGLPLFAANCNVGGTTIFYSNGLNNDYVSAFHSAVELEILVKDRVSSAPAIAPACLGYGIAWNAQTITTSRSWLDNFINPLIQGGVIATIQLAATYLDNLWADIFAGLSAPPKAQQALGIVLQNALAVFQPDLQRQVSQYQFELGQGNKLIVVAHSQGNLYVTQAYAIISPPRLPAASAFDVVAVATPANASTVPGGGPYVTLTRDFINAVPGTSPPNADNGDCGSPLACHSFENSYMPGSVSGRLILDAVVNAIPIPLTVNVDGAGAGSVSSFPAGVSACDRSSSPCSAAFPLNASATVELTATEVVGSGFSKWSGPCTQAAIISGHDIRFPLSLTSPQSCIATFDFLLSIGKAGNGTGTVSSVPTGISCGPACSAQNAPFSATTPVQLTAALAPGSIFGGWGGDCASGGMNESVQITVNASKSCTATFALGGELTINKAGSGTGTVTSVPAGISCGPSCPTQTVAFPASSPVQLTAAVAPGSMFTGWSGDCTGAPGPPVALSTTITVNADKICTATFDGALPAVTLNPFGNQTISSAPGPYLVQVVNPHPPSQVIAAPADITLRINRAADTCQFSFSTTSTVVIPQGQASASLPNAFAAGRDQGCPGVPVTTTWTVLSAVVGPDAVPLVISQGTLSVTR